MKFFIFSFFLVNFVLAEPPQYRAARFRVEAQELNEAATSGSAPYPAAGFRPAREFILPSRQSLTPPATAYGIPADSYSAPLNTYLSPQFTYGVPETPPKSENLKEQKDDKKKAPTEVLKSEPKKAEPPKTEATKSLPAKLEVAKPEVKKAAETKSEKPKPSDAKGEKPKEKSTNEKIVEKSKTETDVFSAQGAYYVLLPDYQLQRVQFQTENDLRNMAYTARLQYKNEDRAPVYVYTAVPQYKSAAYIQLI